MIFEPTDSVPANKIRHGQYISVTGFAIHVSNVESIKLLKNLTDLDHEKVLLGIPTQVYINTDLVITTANGKQGIYRPSELVKKYKKVKQ